MSSCLPCMGLHPDAQLLNDCYPPPKQLLASAPDYKPLSSDLSKMLYRCTNQTSKLARIGDELEKRVVKEAYRSTGGYPKSRASLLISLAILRALISECRRDLSLFARNIIRIINTSLGVRVYQKGAPDLEVIGRAASCFIAFVTYTDGSSIGADEPLNRTYLGILRSFAALAIDDGTSSDNNNATSEKPDEEQRNRTRLIALAALNGACGSEALFSSSTAEFPRQTAIIVPSLLANIFEGSIAQLKLETAKIEMDASPSPFFSEFSARRPVNDRRAPSLHAHIPGEKGPAMSDVLSAALRSLHALVRQCQAIQASHVLDAVVTFLDRQRWQDVERCCWLAERLTAFMLLQYRFVIPTRLVEVLLDLDDRFTTKHTSLLAMITTVLNSPVSLVGLGVPDLLNNLVSLIVRRIRADPADGLLPALVQCLASLGTHIYYADQINDIIEELAVRIAEVPQGDSARPEILRVLIHCMTAVMTTAVAADAAEVRSAKDDPTLREKGKAPQVDTPLEMHRVRTGRRSPITPQTWQETVPLLCEAKYAVRVAYARALLLYLENEFPRDPAGKPSDPAVYRFCNAVHAAIYTLAMSSCLGAGTPVDSVQNSPAVHASAVAPDPDVPLEKPRERRESPERSSPRGSAKGVSFNVTEPTPSATPRGSGTATPSRKPVRQSRRVCLPLTRVNSSAVLTSFDNVATPFDFAAMVMILDRLNTACPVSALVTGVPMLLALDKDAGIELIRRPNDGRAGAWVLERKRSIREVIALVWSHLGRRWNVRMVEELADKQLNSLPEPFEVPNFPQAPEAGILPPPEEPVQFVQVVKEGETSAASQPLLDPEVLVSAMVSNNGVTSATGKDAQGLLKRWAGRWTVETALKDSVERFSSANVRPDDDPHYDVANVLMSLNNSSYQSFNRPASRAVDVADLREALGGRTDTITSSSPPSIVSTSGARSFNDDSASGARSRMHAGGHSGGRGGNHPPDVKEVLKEIFRDRKRGTIKGGSRGKKQQPPIRVNGGAVTGDTGSESAGKSVEAKMGRTGGAAEVNGVKAEEEANGNGSGGGAVAGGFVLGPTIDAKA